MQANANYSILSTPYGKDTYGQMSAAFRARGMRTGVYVCPSFWNRDDYFAPDALTSFGTCCQPNYQPSANPAAWDTFTSYLHEQLSELATTYKPDHFCALLGADGRRGGGGGGSCFVCDGVSNALVLGWVGEARLAAHDVFVRDMGPTVGLLALACLCVGRRA